MSIESNKLVVDHILVRYGELSTKGKNKNDFTLKYYRKISFDYLSILRYNRKSK